MLAALLYVMVFEISIPVFPVKRCACLLLLNSRIHHGVQY